MMPYYESYKKLEQVYFECMGFWEKEGKNNLTAHKYAMKDIEYMEHDPFSPNGDLLDPDAKADFWRHYTASVGGGQ